MDPFFGPSMRSPMDPNKSTIGWSLSSETIWASAPSQTSSPQCRKWTNPSLDILYLHNCPVWHANPLCKRIVSPRSSESKQRTKLCCRSKMWLVPWLTAPNDRSFASRITPCHSKSLEHFAPPPLWPLGPVAACAPGRKTREIEWTRHS